MHRLQHGHVVYNTVFSKFINFHMAFSCLVRGEFEMDFPILCAESPPADFSRSLFFQKISKNLLHANVSRHKKNSPPLWVFFFYSECRLSLLILLLLLLSLSSFNSAFIFSRLRRRKEECSSSSTTHNTHI